MYCISFPKIQTFIKENTLLNADQLYQFNTFGFVVMKNVFSQEEMKVIQREFDTKAAEASSYEKFTGLKTQNFNMMGGTTPFYASLLEDPRFLDAAKQMYGEVLAHGADANRYVGNTYWHYDAGSYEGSGVKFAIYLQPVDANTGALRVIPGSHKRPWFDDLDKKPPLRYAWVRLNNDQAEDTKVIESIPSFVCKSTPGDVVAFDMRIYHASVGGSSDRHHCTLVYRNYPKTPQEVAATISEAEGFMTERDNSSTPWNPKKRAPDEWLDNPSNNSARQFWIDEWMKFSNMTDGKNGYKTVAIDGKIKVVEA